MGKFYNANNLRPIAERMGRIDFHGLAAQWRMPVELAYELAALSLFDIAVFVDDSGSMAFEDNGARIEELKRILSRIAQVATLFDEDGICVRFMNNAVEGNGITDADAVTSLIQQVRFSGMTPLGTRLEERVLVPFVYNSIRANTFTKPVLVYVITDGEPSGETREKVFQVVGQCKHHIKTAGYGAAVNFEFAQVGKDAGAEAFLGRLDNDVSFGDIVDTTSYFELEAEQYAKKGVQLTPDLWMLKLMLGSVDPSYDDQD